MIFADSSIIFEGLIVIYPYTRMADKENRVIVAQKTILDNQGEVLMLSINILLLY